MSWHLVKYGREHCTVAPQQGIFPVKPVSLIGPSIIFFSFFLLLLLLLEPWAQYPQGSVAVITQFPNGLAHCQCYFRQFFDIIAHR